jgi:hypothetical protein
LAIKVNDSDYIGYVRSDPNDGLWMAIVTALWKFTGEDPDDYVTLQARQETGSPLNTTDADSYATEFAAQRIG